MSQILEMLTVVNESDKEKSSLLSDESISTNKKFSKKKVNFIEKNKGLVSKHKSLKPNTDIIIRCLNDNIDEHIKVAASVKTDETSFKPTYYGDLNNSNQIEFEISIISNHSSIESDNELNNNKTNKKLNENEKENELIQGEEYKPESDLVFSSDYLKLKSNERSDHLPNEEDDVNIIKCDQSKSKIRSQFMQRFGSAHIKKRQIIPNLIDPNHVRDSPVSTITNTIDSSPSTLQLRQPYHNFYTNDQDPLTTASIAASLAAMSVVNSQPFAKIHNDLEDKITCVLKELENMRKSDDKLAQKLIKKNKKVKDCQESDSDDENRNEMRKSQEKESESRIKYLEKLQEKQFDMMSQLINVIGTENSNANLTAKNGKESLIKFKKQISLIHDDYDDNPDEDYIQFSQNLNKKSKKTLPAQNSRSRTQSVKKRSNKETEIKKNAESSHSRSNSRSCCRMKNTTNRLRSSSDYANNKLQKTDFLEELLDLEQPKSTPKPVTSSNNINQTKSVSTMINESQPLLFDKYLNEVKNNLKKNEPDSFVSVETLNKKIQKSPNESLTKPTDAAISEEKILTKGNISSKNMSMFSDIKEVLKAVEYSKTKIDANIAELARERDNKMFYLLNSHLNEENDRIRIKKMVDGCINAISDDVQKEVTQKLIDESKNIKLKAEKDTNSFRSRFARNQKQNQKRSVSSAEIPNAKSVSQTNRYIGKIFGKSLLDQIKLEKSEESNMKLKKQILEQQKLKRDLEQCLQKEINQTNKQKQHKTLLLSQQNISNKKQSVNIKEKRDEPVKNDAVITPRLILDPQRSAFASTQIKTEITTARSKSNDKNVALITISPVEITNVSPIISPLPSIKTKPIKELIKQNLPSVNINPNEQTETESTSTISSSHNSKKNTIENRNEENNEESDGFDINQSGTGIHLPGHIRPNSNASNLNRNYMINPSSNLINEQLINQLSNETNQLAKTRDILENKTFSWLEQEMMARFISRLVNTENQFHGENYQYDEFDEKSEKHNPIDIREADLMNAIGQQGFQLFVDIGQPVDPDLIQALVREVLEEKISSISLNKEILPEDRTQLNPASTGPPMPSPRNLNRKSMEIMDQPYLNLEVRTPVPTPDRSPPLSPTVRNKILTPQISVEKEPKGTPEMVQPVQMPQIMAYNLLDEDEASLLEETLQENDDVELELDEIDYKYDTKSIVTPRETPVPTPSPPNDFDTPIESSISEKIKPKAESSLSQPSQPIQPPITAPQQPVPPPQPQPEPRSFRAKSIQCDVMPQKRESINSDTSSSLTESTQYTSEDASNTLSTKTNQVDDEEDSYFSEGAWLLSKSEGQIVPLKQNDYVNLDLLSAAKSLILSPRETKEKIINVDTITSDGELNIKNVNQSDMFLYGGKQKNTVNRIIKNAERGEVIANDLRKSTFESFNEKSEGEIDILREVKVEKKNDKTYTANKSTNLKTLNNVKKSTELSKTKIDQTIIDLNISPTKHSINNIKIESLSNQTKTKDSTEFERKLFSSTPDTTMMRVPSVTNANYITDDDEVLDGYESGEQEIEIDNSPSPPKRRGSRDSK